MKNYIEWKNFVSLTTRYLAIFQIISFDRMEAPPEALSTENFAYGGEGEGKSKNIF